MKGLQRFVTWVLMGAVFGTLVGVVGRYFGLNDLTAGLAAGALAGPIVIMLVLLGDQWISLVYWAIGGFIAGLLIHIALSAYADAFVSTDHLRRVVSSPESLNSAIVGSALALWFGSLWMVIRGGARGTIAILGAIIGGAFLGAFTWIVAAIIGGPERSIQFFDFIFVWRWGETIAGIPIGLVTGGIATRFLLDRQRTYY
ncbi:MAG: hypothetical protein ABFQ89_01125 [Chloroflexota bacterium]